MTEIILKNFDNDKDEAKLVKIYKSEGEFIKAGDILFELESDKASMEVNAEQSGVISSIKFEEGDKVKVGSTLAIIDKTKDSEKDDEIPENRSLEQENSRDIEAKQNKNYDIAILGAGPGGYVAAIKAAQMGAKVALIEKEKLGGTCLNWGCIPTKALVRSAEVYRTLETADKYGFNVGSISPEWDKIQARKDGVVSQLISGIERLMDFHEIDVINGEGQLINQNTIEVGEGKKEVKAENIIIATGSEPSSLAIEGADLPGVLNSKEALALTDLPDKLLIVGGGIIGLEFAFIFAAFKVEVTVIEYLDNVIDSCDKEVCQEINRIARRRGIRIIRGARVEKIARGLDDSYTVFFNKEGQEELVSGDMVLMAVGRKPVFPGVNPEELGLAMNEEGPGIKVNSRMKTNISGIYAIGDVTNRIQLAHVASHQGLVAVKNIMGEDCEMNYDAVPSAIFTDPEIGEVGITEKVARERGIEIKVGKFPFVANGKVLTVGESEGFIKLISEKDSGEIIGGSIIGVHATDLLAELTLAVKNQLTAEELVETIHAHPTTAEVVHEAALDLEGGALHYIS